MRFGMKPVVIAMVALGAAVLPLAAGCPEPEVDDDVPPRVLGVEPSAPVVPVTASFRVLFSEDLNRRTVVGDVTLETLTVVLAPRFDDDNTLVVDESFLSDLDNDGLGVSRQDDVIPIDVELEEGSAIRVTPRAPLRPATAYTLVVNAVRDEAGNPIVDASGVKAPFLWEFSTDAGPPLVSRTDIGASGIVVPNRRRITVTFNQPVIRVDTSSLRIEGTPAPVVEAVLVEDTVVAGQPASVATLLLAPLGGGCERLGAGASYTLVASSSIEALTGQPLEEYREELTASSTCDTLPNVLSGLTSTAADVTALVRFVTTKPSTTEIRYGVAGGALDCLGAPCPVLGAPTTAANALHTVTVGGLTVDVDYDFVVSAEDEVGSVARGTGSFRTAPLPKIAVNELMADADTSQDAQGEYVELASWETAATVDLGGWRLRVTKINDPDAAPNEALIPTPGPTLAPGAFLVLADTSFEAAHYPGLAEASVFMFGDFDALQNEEILVEILDPGGRTVSSMSAPRPSSGRSVERTSPDAPDEPASFCLSRTDTGPTPGAQNGVASRGCE